MRSIGFGSAIQEAARSSAMARAVESASIREIAKSMSAMGRINNYANELSRAARFSGATRARELLEQPCGPRYAMENHARKMLHRETRARQALIPNMSSTYKSMVNEVTLPAASNKLVQSARDATALIEGVVGPRAMLDTFRDMVVVNALPKIDVGSVTGSGEVDVLNGKFDDAREARFVTIRPINIHTHRSRSQPQQLVLASELTEARRSEIAHRHVYVLESVLRNFICQRMQKAFGDTWLLDPRLEKRRNAWKNRRRRAGASGRDIDLIDFAGFGEYVWLITDDDDVWASAFEPILHDKEATTRLLGRLNRYRRATSHSRGLLPGELIGLHYDVVHLLALIAPDSIDDLPVSILFKR